MNKNENGQESRRTQWLHGDNQVDQNGFILALGLVMLAAVSVVGVVAMQSSQTDVSISANYRDSQMATSAAESGIELARAAIAQYVSANGTDAVFNATTLGVDGEHSIGEAKYTLQITSTASNDDNGKDNDDNGKDNDDNGKDNDDNGKDQSSIERLLNFLVPTAVAGDSSKDNDDNDSSKDNDDNDSSKDNDDNDSSKDNDDNGTKITICHVTGNGSGQHTISISENAWSAHEAHGDIQGACPAGVDVADVTSVGTYNGATATVTVTLQYLTPSGAVVAVPGTYTAQ